MDRPETTTSGGPTLSRKVAEAVWAERRPALQRQAPADRPMLVQFAGTPLSGKSTVARAFVDDVTIRTVHVENDALRLRISALLGRPPQQDRFEHFLTYQTAWELAGLALTNGAHAVHDATNLDERGRRKAYALADDLGVDLLVVFVRAPSDVLAARSELVDADRRGAYEKYVDRSDDAAECTRPHVVLDGALPVTQNLARLRDEEALGGFWTT